jgi:hypothetical protein
MNVWKTAAVVLGVVLVARALRPAAPGLSGNIFNSRSYAATRSNKGNMGLARRQEQPARPQPATSRPARHANFNQPIQMVRRGGWR